MTRRKKAKPRKSKPAVPRKKAGHSLPPAPVPRIDQLIAIERQKPAPWRYEVSGYSFKDGTRYLLPCVSLSTEGPLWRVNGWALMLRGEFWHWCGSIAVGKWA